MTIFNDSVGVLTVIAGPMFSEKSGELISYCQKASLYQKKSVIVLKPEVDTRWESNKVTSRTAGAIDAITIPAQFDVEQVYESIKDNEVVGIDEIQFFDSDLLVALINMLMQKKTQVIATGLNMDFKGNPFKTTANLMCMANEVLIKHAYCEVCGQPAIHSFLKEAQASDNNVVIGNEIYAPRCRQHFHVLSK